MNQTLLSGWLTADPEIGPTNKGQFCNFTLGVLEYKYKDDKGKGLFVPIFCYNDTAERIKKTCVKGSFIFVTSAKLVQQEWTNKEGQKRSQLKVQMFSFEVARFGTGKEDEQGRTLEQAFSDLPFDNQ
jgi:single-stranded DNA-binding protein